MNLNGGVQWGSSHDSGRIVRLERLLEHRFETLNVFCYEFVGLIWAVEDGLSLQRPQTRSGMLILLRVALGGDIHATRVGGSVSFPA